MEGTELRVASFVRAPVVGNPMPSSTAFDPTELAARLKEKARANGFRLVGITTPDASEHLGRYRSWLEGGMHGEMRYLARSDAVRRRGDLRETMEGVRSVLVVGHEYAQDDPPGVPDDASRGVIARYARGRDYHKVVKKKLRALGRWLDEAVPSTPDTDAGPPSWRAYVDTGPILERDLARRAGLGWFGKNTMILNPKRGSYFFLGVLLLDLALPPDQPFEADHCGSCRACLDACPTGALLGRDENGAPIMDARRCISYLTIEHRGPIPVELRPLMGNRVFGCDICQECCPFTRTFSKPSAEPAYASRAPGESPVGVEPEPGSSSSHPGTDSPSLIELLETGLDEASWDSFSRGSAIRRAGRAGFARNVCVGLGNWGSPDAVPVLTSALSDPEPLVRAHAAWALGRVGTAAAREALSSRLSVESDESVRSEFAAALAP